MSAVSYVCRKRASAYARAVKEAAPQAIEVADRWHLLRSFSLPVEKTCHEHRPCLQKYAERAQRAGPRMSAQEALPPTLIVDRVVWRHEEIDRMVDVGYPLSEIARRLGLDRKTVRRYRDTSFDVLLASARDRPRPQERTPRPVQAISAGRVRRRQDRCHGAVPADPRTGLPRRVLNSLPLRGDPA
ncbi:transposase [Streptomyces mirabilis]|uniref:transposase n=1 Tax=Streptomyces mirabilis TaxID=68239 RepID=UPI0036DCBE3B